MLVEASPERHQALRIGAGVVVESRHAAHHLQERTSVERHRAASSEFHVLDRRAASQFVRRGFSERLHGPSEFGGDGGGVAQRKLRGPAFHDEERGFVRGVEAHEPAAHLDHRPHAHISGAEVHVRPRLLRRAALQEGSAGESRVGHGRFVHRQRAVLEVKRRDEGSFAINLVHLPTGFRHDRRGETHHLALVHRPRVVVHRLWRFGHQSVAALQRVGVRADSGHVRRRRRALHRRGTRRRRHRRQIRLFHPEFRRVPLPRVFVAVPKREQHAVRVHRPSDLELAPMVKRATSAAHRILARGTNADAVPPLGSRQLLPPQNLRELAHPAVPRQRLDHLHRVVRQEIVQHVRARRPRRSRVVAAGSSTLTRGEESKHSTVQLEKLASFALLQRHGLERGAARRVDWC